MLSRVLKSRGIERLFACLKEEEGGDILRVVSWSSTIIRAWHHGIPPTFSPSLTGWFRDFALDSLLLQALTLLVAPKNTPILDESVFETHRGARPMQVGAIGQIHHIMHKGQGGMQPPQAQLRGRSGHPAREYRDPHSRHGQILGQGQIIAA
jgi:hypothetical protein